MPSPLRLAALLAAALVAGLFTASLAMGPLCSIFPGKKHYSNRESVTVSMLAPGSTALVPNGWRLTLRRNAYSSDCAPEKRDRARHCVPDPR